MGYTSTNLRGRSLNHFFDERFALGGGYHRCAMKVTEQHVLLLVEDPSKLKRIYAAPFDRHPEPGYDIGYGTLLQLSSDDPLVPAAWHSEISTPAHP